MPILFVIGMNLKNRTSLYATKTSSIVNSLNSEAYFSAHSKICEIAPTIQINLAVYLALPKSYKNLKITDWKKAQTRLRSSRILQLS